MYGNEFAWLRTTRNLASIREIGEEAGDAKFEPPTMFLYGAESDVIAYRSGGWFPEGMKKWFADMRVFEAVPDCGHWLPLEQSELVTGKLLAFFAAF